MKKKFLSAMLLGLVALGISTTFVSCKDYDDDISAVKSDVSSLQTLTTSLQNTLSDLKTQLATAQSDLATAKAATETNKQNIANLTARVAALETKISIAQEALDKANANAASITDLQKAVNILNGNITTLEEKDAALQKQIDVINAFLANPDYDSLAEAFADLKAQILAAQMQEVSDVSQLQTKISELSDKLDDEVANRTAAINGVNVRIDAIWAELSIITADLRSLVYMPYLYVGGIESIEYPFYNVSSLVNDPAKVEFTRESATLGSQALTIPEKTDWKFVTGTSETIIINPVTTVDYHLNPAGAKTDGDDMANYNVRGAELVGPSSRAAGSIEVNSPKTYANGDVAWKSEGGVFTAPFQVATTSWLNTSNDKNFTNSDNIVAFQAKTKKSTSADAKVVTSDYALVFPEEMHIEGLVYTQAPNAGNSQSEAIADDDEGAACHKMCHVFETPRAALEAAAKGCKGADFDLYYNDDNGIKLEDYLGIHVTYKQAYTKAITEDRVYTIPFVGQNNKFKRDGLTYEFHPVEYTIGGNTTIDSRFCTLDANTGNIIARDVDKDGKTITTGHNRASVGRQPLVQVLVKYGDKVILDGYILVNISEKIEEVTVDKYTYNATMDLCGESTLMKTTWAQFNSYILSSLFDTQWTKDQFDATYLIDNSNGITSNDKTTWGSVKKSNAIYQFDAKVYTENKNKATATSDYGTVTYTYDENGATNHTFVWSISATQLEKIMHGETSKTFSVYIRYNLVTNPNRHIWLKLTTTVTRPSYATTWGTKIANYWYNQTGTKEDIIAADVTEPLDGSYVNQTWTQDLTKGLVGNKIDLSKYTMTAGSTSKEVDVNNKKFYFAPEVIYVTDEYTGTQYEITPQYKQADKISSLNANFNKMICLYDNTKKYDYDVDQLNTILNKCTVKFGCESAQNSNKGTAGVFDNDALYVKNGNKYELFATMNQFTGEITMSSDNSWAKKLVNCVGYQAEHAQIMKELRAKVGVIGKAVDCNIAQYVADPEFYSSWERPINFDEFAYEDIDAKTNQINVLLLDYLNVYDWRNVNMSLTSNQRKNAWFWAFYQIQSITVNCERDKVMTNLHQASEDKFVALNTITTKIVLEPYAGNVNSSKTYNFWSNIKDYNKADQNANLLTYMDGNKKNFGGFTYANNGENVKTFKVKIPVTINYIWGSITKDVTFTINNTQGN